MADETCEFCRIVVNKRNAANLNEGQPDELNAAGAQGFQTVSSFEHGTDVVFLDAAPRKNVILRGKRTPRASRMVSWAKRAG
jgi:hypothetical protein